MLKKKRSDFDKNNSEKAALKKRLLSEYYRAAFSVVLGFLIVIIILSLCFCSCKKPQSAEDKLLASGYLKVTFDGQGGNCSANYDYAILVKYSGKIIEPGIGETPYFTKDNCFLEGWYKNKECVGEKWNFTADTVKENMILFANFIIQGENE